MSTPEPKPSPWTPSFWATVGSVVLSALLASAVTSAVQRRDVDDLRAWQKDAQTWMVGMEKRVTESERQNAVANKGTEKDLQQMKDQLNTIQQMLIGRAPAVIAPASGRQPYP